MRLWRLQAPCRSGGGGGSATKPQGSGANQFDGFRHNLAGHKEDQAARDLALRLAAALGAVVVVTAGIHVDAADEAGIERIMANFEDAALQLLNRFRK